MWCLSPGYRRRSCSGRLRLSQGFCAYGQCAVIISDRVVFLSPSLPLRSQLSYPRHPLFQLRRRWLRSAGDRVPGFYSGAVNNVVPKPGIAVVCSGRSAVIPRAFAPTVNVPSL